MQVQKHYQPDFTVRLYDTHNICLLTDVRKDLEGRAVMKVYEMMILASVYL